MLSLAAVGLSGAAQAALDIQAKPVKTDSNQEEEIWVIRIDLKNTGSTPLGSLVIQYRYSGFSEFDSDGKPEGALEHTEATIKQVVAVIAPGQKVSVDSLGMNFVGEGNQRRLAKGMIQSIRVRAWQNGKLIGEFAEEGGKASDGEWPLNPPPIPEGAEVGSGPWLLLEKDRADFFGISLGASAVDVLKMLKTCGPGKIDAKSEAFHGHPLRMSSADLPGVVFGFDAAKKLSAIEITDPSRLKLPGKVLLGKTRFTELDSTFGLGTKPSPASDPFGTDKTATEPTFVPCTKPDPLPTGATDARQFQFAGYRLTIAATSSIESATATSALLEKTP